MGVSPSIGFDLFLDFSDPFGPRIDPLVALDGFLALLSSVFQLQMSILVPKTWIFEVFSFIFPGFSEPGL